MRIALSILIAASAFAQKAVIPPSTWNEPGSQLQVGRQVNAAPFVQVWYTDPVNGQNHCLPGLDQWLNLTVVPGRLWYCDAPDHWTILQRGVDPTATMNPGNVTVTPLATPAAPVVTPTCAGNCSSVYDYVQVCYLPDGSHTEASPVGIGSPQAAALDGTHFNTIALPLVTNAAYCNVYRTVGGSTQGKITAATVSSGATLRDAGLTADGTTVPATNTTGSVKAAALQLQAGPLGTCDATVVNQLRVGTGAQAGIWKCSTNGSWYQWSQVTPDPYNCFASSSGVGLNYSCTTTPTLTQYSAGTALNITVDVANLTGTPTINASGLGVVALTLGNGVDSLPPGTLQPNGAYLFVYDSALTVFRMVNGPALTFQKARTIGGCPLFPDQVLFNTDISAAPIDLFGTQYYLGLHHNIVNATWASSVATLTLDSVSGYAAGMRLFVVGVNGADAGDATGFNTGVGRATIPYVDNRVVITSIDYVANTITYALGANPGAYSFGGTVSTGPYGGLRFGATPSLSLNLDSSASPGWTAYQFHTAPDAPDGYPVGISYAITNLTNSDNVNYPMKLTYTIEGNNPDGSAPTVGSNANNYCGQGDAHVFVLDTARCEEYEISCLTGGGVSAQDNLTGPPFSAENGSFWPLYSPLMRTARITSNDSTGLSSNDAAGLPIYVFTSSGAEIRGASPANPIKHMQRISFRNSQNTFQWPAVHFASKSSQYFFAPMGAVFRLRADFDTTTCHNAGNAGQAYPPYVQAYLWTLQHYGAINADNGQFLVTVGSDFTSAQDADLAGWLHCIMGDNWEVVNVNPLQKSATSFEVQSFTPQSSPLPVLTTLATVPYGLTLTIDGQTCTAPCQMWLPKNTAHTITAAAVTSGGNMYTFSSWSDAGAASHVITSSAAATYTATFTAQYYLTTSVSPPGDGTVSPGGWYNSGQVVSVSATPGGSFLFAGFSGDLTGTTTPQNVTMDSAKTVVANFYSTTWTNNVTITTSCPTNCGASDQTAFPVFFKATDPNLKTVANGGQVQSSAGADILLFADSGATTQLASEIQSYDPVAGSVSGWVRIPTLHHAAPDTAYLFIGNVAPPPRSGPVWDSNYHAVWHMEGNSPIVDAVGLYPSTSVTGTTVGAGEVGNAISFGGADHAEFSSISSLSGASQVTVEWWANASSSFTGFTGLFNQWASGQGLYVETKGPANDILINFSSGNSASTSTTSLFPLNTWAHFMLVFDGTQVSQSNRVALYKNGVAQTLILGGTVPAFISSTGSSPFGIAQADASRWSGGFDEFRVSTGAARSVDWAIASYQNQSAPGNIGAPAWLTWGSWAH